MVDYVLKGDVLEVHDHMEYTDIYKLCVNHDIKLIKLYMMRGGRITLVFPREDINVAFIMCKDFHVHINSNVKDITIDTCIDTSFDFPKANNVKLIDNNNCSLNVDNTINTLHHKISNHFKYIEIGNVDTINISSGDFNVDYFVVKQGRPNLYSTQGIKNSFGLNGLFVPNNLIYINQHLINIDNGDVVKFIINEGVVDTHKFDYDVLNGVFPLNDLMQYMV